MTFSVATHHLFHVLTLLQSLLKLLSWGHSVAQRPNGFFTAKRLANLPLPIEELAHATYQN